MPYRVIPFVNDQIYHIYNRGSEKRVCFRDRRDYNRFLKTIKYYQLKGPKPRFSLSDKFLAQLSDSNPQIIEILAFCLMPNHFHLLIRQLEENGITEFIRKISDSYTKYFNTRHNRVGPLFQGMTKAVLVEKDEHLIHLSRYIHLNPHTSFLVKNLDDYQWSSYHEYINSKKGLCNKELISGYFKTPEKHQEFVLDQASYAQDIWLIKHQLLEDS